MKRIDPQKAQPKSMEKCQEDAKGSKDGSNYLNGRVRGEGWLDWGWGLEGRQQLPQREGEGGGVAGLGGGGARRTAATTSTGG